MTFCIFTSVTFRPLEGWWERQYIWCNAKYWWDMCHPVPFLSSTSNHKKYCTKLNLIFYSLVHSIIIGVLHGVVGVKISYFHVYVTFCMFSDESITKAQDRHLGLRTQWGFWDRACGHLAIGRNLGLAGPPSCNSWFDRCEESQKLVKNSFGVLFLLWNYSWHWPSQEHYLESCTSLNVCIMTLMRVCCGLWTLLRSRLGTCSSIISNPGHLRMCVFVPDEGMVEP